MEGGNYNDDDDDDDDGDDDDGGLSMIFFKTVDCHFHFSSQGEIYVHPEKGLEAGGNVDR